MFTIYVTAKKFIPVDEGFLHILDEKRRMAAKLEQIIANQDR